MCLSTGTIPLGLSARPEVRTITTLFIKVNLEDQRRVRMNVMLIAHQLDFLPQLAGKHRFIKSATVSWFNMQTKIALVGVKIVP